MLISHQWLKELSGIDASARTVEQKLTAAGLEVEGARHRGEGLEQVVVAEVKAKERHPKRDKLTLVRVFDGEQDVDVICGAANVPEPGGRVVLARVGATLPNGMEIEPRKLGGVPSHGMLCSEIELDIGVGEEGIIVLDESHPCAWAQPGTSIAEALALRDTVFEIGLTPNRPDCLGHVGVARELCLLMGRPFEPPPPSAPSSMRHVEAGCLQPVDIDLRERFPDAPKPQRSEMPSVTVEIRDAQRCPRYAAALVRGVTIAPSPFHVRYRLHLLGLRPINNVVDATNLILLGHGHPIHGFDLDTLHGHRIVVRLAEDGERLITLDGEERTLTGDDLLICDADRPVALAGVMGGQQSEIGDGTRDVLIECAYFDPRSVRRTSRRTGLHTDSSYRFERGVDPNGVPGVLAHAAALIQSLAGGEVAARAIDFNPRPVRSASMHLRQRRIEAVVGMAVSAEETEALLRRLGCHVEPVEGAWHVDAPTFRPDIAREIDLIEEVVRVRGYDSVPTRVPYVLPSEAGTPPEVEFIRALRTHVADAGLDEAINYAFVARADLEAARVASAAVALQNPLSEDRGVLRTSLLPGLAGNLRRAQHHQVPRFASFEIARVFRAQPDEALPDERYELGMLMWGPRQHWFGPSETMDFYDAKGVAQAALRPLCGMLPTTHLDEMLERRAPYLHPRRRAALRLGDRAVGHLGELHPEVAEALHLEGRPLYVSVEVGALHAAVAESGTPELRALPRFPAVDRDLAVVVAEEVTAGEVAEVLRQAGGALIEDVVLFDLYRGQPVPEDHKSLAFHVVYRDPNATLTDKIVDKRHAQVTRAAEERFAAKVRV